MLGGVLALSSVLTGSAEVASVKVVCGAELTNVSRLTREGGGA
jgi:hypothetical protein